MLQRKIVVPLFTDISLIVAVLLTRIPMMSQYLHQWDSVQFALALSNFDITREQPHPPGYPGYIGFAWLIRRIVPDDNLSLVIVGIISAMIIAIAMHHIGRILISPRAGIFAGILGVLNPLLWYFSDIALSYIAGTAFATLAVWASLGLKDRAKLWVPLLAGFSCIFWLPAGILVGLACLYAFLHGEGKSKIVGRIFAFIGLFLIPIIVAYGWVIAHTGGFGPYLAAVQGQTGKHVSQISQWMQSPLDEFIKNTGSIADFFKEGFAMGRWLFLILLIPMPGEKGVQPSRAIGLIPLFAVGIIVLHYGNNTIVRTAGIVLSTIAALYMIPTPTIPESRFRRNFLFCWLVGIVLFVPVYVNYVGILLIFLPAFVLIEAWMIDRAGVFMALQTIRDESTVEKDGKSVQVPAKAPDIRVDRLVAWLLIILVAMNQFGTFAAKNPRRRKA